MKLRVGYELIYDCPQPTPMILMLHIHHTRAPDIIIADQVTTDPTVPVAVVSRWLRQLVQPARRSCWRNTDHQHCGPA